MTLILGYMLIGAAFQLMLIAARTDAKNERNGTGNVIAAFAAAILGLGVSIIVNATGG